MAKVASKPKEVTIEGKQWLQQNVLDNIGSAENSQVHYNNPSYMDRNEETL